MANFSKLNIGDRVASSGLRRFRKLSVEQLPSPYSVTIDGDYLSWGDYSCFATSFDILVDGVVKATVSAPTNSFDLSTLGLADGTYSITVVSKADGYLDSDPSEAVEYVVGEDELAGTWVLNNSLSIDDGVNDWGVNFQSNGASFTTLSAHNIELTMPIYCIYYDSETVYDSGSWSNSAYKTITITSKLSEVTNGDTLLTWLKANATKQ